MDQPPDAPCGRLGRHGRRRRHRSKRALAGIATLISLAVVTVAVFGFVVYHHLDANIRTLDITRALGGNRDTAPIAGTSAMNVLLLGSDTRAGQGTAYGPNTHAGLSDTAMLVHLDTGRQHAIVVSIPRDLIAARPSCLIGSGDHATWTKPQAAAQINTALAVGGPACTIRTVQQLTGLRVDHFVEIDFDGFKHMVNAIGGVEVCLPKAVDDPDSRLDLSAGRHLVKGNQALAFVRDRHGVGDGSDLDRIQMQHQFMASLFQKVSSTGLLQSPSTLYRLANTATNSITTDPALGSVDNLLAFAHSMQRLTASNVVFTTLPTVPDPANADRLLPDPPADAALYARLRGKGAPRPTGAAHAARQAAAPPTALTSQGARHDMLGEDAASSLPTASIVRGSDVRIASQDLCSGNPA
jgi:LCP family protein required for cell wall assembly